MASYYCIYNNIVSIHGKESETNLFKTLSLISVLSKGLSFIIFQISFDSSEENQQIFFPVV